MMGDVLVLLALAAAVSARVELAPALREWQTELERAGVRVSLARVYTDAERNVVTLPEDAPVRPLFAGMLRQQVFIEQLMNAHALTANFRGISLVFLNMRRAAEWEGHEEALLAHEFAHIALKARGYESARAPDLAACQITHATNIVQHVLVRRELAARGIDDVPFRVHSLQAAQDAGTDVLSGGGTACDKARRLEMWVDVALGLTDQQWARRPEFLSLLEKSWPELSEAAGRLITKLQGGEISEKPVYESALVAAGETLRQLK